VGSNPKFFNKICPLRPKVYRGINSSISLLPQTLYDNAVNYKRDASLHILYNIRNECFDDEVHSCFAPLSRVMTRSAELAIIMVQRNARKCLARRKYLKLCRLRDEEIERQRRINFLRKNNPRVNPYPKRNFLVVALSAIQSSPILRERDALVDVAVSLSETITHVDPSITAAELKNLIRALPSDEFSFLYLVGPGAYACYSTPVPPSLQIANLFLEETHARMELHGWGLHEGMIRLSKEHAKILSVRSANIAAPPPGTKVKGSTKGTKGKASQKAAAAPPGMNIDESERVFRSLIESWAMKSHEELLCVCLARVQKEAPKPRSVAATSEKVYTLRPVGTAPHNVLPSNSIAVLDLADIFLGHQPEIGQQRVLVVDTAPDEGSEGFCFVGVSNGQRALYRYGQSERLLLSHVVRKALRGHASQQPQGVAKPGKKSNEESCKIIDAQTFFAYVTGKMIKMDFKTPLNHPITVGTYVADIIVCNTILKTAAERRAQHKSQQDNTRRTIQLTLLVNGSTDVISSDYSSKVGSDLHSTIGGTSSLDVGRVTIVAILIGCDLDKSEEAIAVVSREAGSTLAPQLRFTRDETEKHATTGSIIVTTTRGDTDPTQVLNTVRVKISAAKMQFPHSVLTRVIVPVKCTRASAKKMDRAWRQGFLHTTKFQSFVRAEETNLISV